MEEKSCQRDRIDQPDVNDSYDERPHCDKYFGVYVSDNIDEFLVDNENTGLGDVEASDEDDSDFEDDNNCRDDGEVDMMGFRLNTDPELENTGQKSTLQSEDLQDEVLDNEKMDSESDSDVNESSVRKNILKYERSKNENHSNFYIGQCFGTKDEAKELIKLHAVETRRQLKIVKDDHERVRAVCIGDMPSFEIDESMVSGGKGKGIEMKNFQNDNKQLGKKSVGGRGKRKNPEKHSCPWVFLLSRQKDTATWMVKTYVDDHKCNQTRSVKQCTYSFLSKHLMDQIEENPNIPINAVREQFQRKFQVDISRMKAFRAKTTALTVLNGDYNSQYGILRDYLEELVSTNPGTTIKLEVEQCMDSDSNTRRFKRLYVCLGSLKQGFKAIGRDLLGLDGAFMKGPYPGQILTVVGIDPNNGIYPLSYAIVEAETLSSWTWFLQCLGDDLNLVAQSNFTFISDRQKGILPALANVFPCAEHRYCLRHIHENMKQHFRGKAYKDMLWKLATSTTLVQFEKTMEELKNSTMKHIYGYLKSHLNIGQEPTFLILPFIGRAHSDVLLNNMCEVLNSKLIDGRDKPIITVLEFIREYLMRRIVNVLKVIDRSDGLLTPTATKIFECIKKEATKYTVSWNGEEHYQVSGPGGDQCVVDMRRNTCVCRRWEITGIPCKHVAAIWNKAANGQKVGQPENFVHAIYRLDKSKEVYNYKVYPINGRALWKKSQIPTTLIPPTHHKPVGRPKKVRKKSALELEDIVKGGRLSKKGMVYACKKCNNKGHNSRSCKGQV